ncbi:polysaccharide biosynthesis protein [Corynebacterium terpenotabidum]|uniref:Polysaccharide biosynthesis protein n=1 Tax=Corynebacterium terpenotabidum Y-11 TaxID=1200352 RepID=S4XGM9_9CORY|nr:hypothetical protein [Corynebacterium terpenotabidum]AGP31696.1 hypothetical protein A606_10285 [Corynebacterium terpenotabidum Y-11]
MQRAGRSLTVATLVVAVSGYAVIVLAGRSLSPADYERFTVYWGLFFACTGVLDGLLQETTRAVTAAQQAPGRPAGLPAGHSVTDADPASGAHPAAVAVGVALGVTALIACTAPLWASSLLPGAGVTGAVLLASGLASYAVQATVCGLLSASGRWRSYAWLISVDSAVRVALAVAAWATGLHLTAFLLVTVIGAATWTGLLLTDRHRTRILLRHRADVPTGEFLRRVGAAMLASGATALLITGFPVLFTVTSRDAAPGTLAAVITAVTLTRAPLLVPLQRFLPALIVHLSRHRDAVRRALLRPLAVVVATALGGGLMAWWLAVPLAGWFFPADLVADAGVFAVLTVASGALAVLMVTGSAMLTVERHGVYVLGWLTATVVAVALLSLDLSPATRAALALGVAPLAGAAVHLAASASPASFRRLRPSRPARPVQPGRAGSSSRTR